MQNSFFKLYPDRSATDIEPVFYFTAFEQYLEENYGLNYYSFSDAIDEKHITDLDRTLDLQTLLANFTFDVSTSATLPDLMDLHSPSCTLVVSEKLLSILSDYSTSIRSYPLNLSHKGKKINGFYLLEKFGDLEMIDYQTSECRHTSTYSKLWSAKDQFVSRIEGKGGCYIAGYHKLFMKKNCDDFLYLHLYKSGFYCSEKLTQKLQKECTGLRFVEERTLVLSDQKEVKTIFALDGDVLKHNRLYSKISACKHYLQQKQTIEHKSETFLDLCKILSINDALPPSQSVIDDVISCLDFEFAKDRKLYSFNSHWLGMIL